MTPTPAHDDSLSRLPGSQVGASMPEPHPEARREIGALLDMARGLAPDLAARASYEVDVLVGRLEQAERTVTNLEQAFTAARDDLEQKDEALRHLRQAEEAARIQEQVGNEGDADAIRRDAIREALGVPPQPQKPDSGASRAGRSEDGA
jgi:hypothetical protein